MSLKGGYTQSLGKCRRQDDGNYSISKIKLDAVAAETAAECAGRCEQDPKCVAFDFEEQPRTRCTTYWIDKQSPYVGNGVDYFSCYTKK